MNALEMEYRRLRIYRCPGGDEVPAAGDVHRALSGAAPNEAVHRALSSAAPNDAAVHRALSGAAPKGVAPKDAASDLGSGGGDLREKYGYGRAATEAGSSCGEGCPERPWTAADEAVLQMLDIAYFAWVRCGFLCDAKQRDLLHRGGKQVVLNCSRQTGKSTLGALKILHTAFWRPGTTIVVSAHVLSHTQELLGKVREFGRVAGLLHQRRGTMYRVELANGSRIVGVAAREGTIRGFSAVPLLAVDEASRVKDEVFEAAEPMLAVSNGALWIFSTPNGRRGYFYKACTSTSDWVKLRMTAEESGRIPAEFLKRQQKKLGDRRYAQEFECEFVELDKGVFDAESVDGAFQRGVKMIPELEI